MNAPIKVNQELADAINKVSTLLKRDFGCDYSYSIAGNGMTIAQYNINGIVSPVVESPEAEVVTPDSPRYWWNAE